MSPVFPHPPPLWTRGGGVPAAVWPALQAGGDGMAAGEGVVAAAVVLRERGGAEAKGEGEETAEASGETRR